MVSASKMILPLVWFFLGNSLLLQAMYEHDDPASLIQHGRVILVCGTTCSGKSKFIRELHKRIKDLSVVPSEFSEVKELRILKHNQQLLVQGWQPEQIYAFDEIKRCVWERLTRTLVCELVPVSSNGVDMTAAFINELHKLQCEVYSILVYSPMDMLLQRCRCVKSDDSIMRMEGFYEPHMVLKQFLAMYKRSAGLNCEIGTVRAGHIREFLASVSAKQQRALMPAVEALIGEGVDKMIDVTSVSIEPVSTDFDAILSNDALNDTTKSVESEKDFNETCDELVEGMQGWLSAQTSFE